MTAPPGLSGPTDAELVARVLTADREAFATVYDRYGTRLYDFAYSMLRHREDAADAVADSFVTFAERLTQLRDPDRLRPWLYAIVRSECLRRLKARKRISYGDDEQLIEMADDAITPEQSAEQTMLRQLVWDAAAGLADRDRAILDLHLRQGLEGAELGEAMGVSASNAYVMLNRLRAQVDRSLGALLIARLGRDDCDQLDALLVDWDGGFSPLIRKRVARHVENCRLCSERRKKIASPWALLAAVPLFAAPLGLRDRVVNDTQLVAYKVPGDPPTGPPPGGGRPSGRTRTMVAAAAVILLAIVGTVVFWPETDEAATTQPTAATPSSTPTTAQPSPTASETPTSTPTPTSAPSPTLEPLPGALTVSTRSINLGRDANKSTVGLTNTGQLPLSYSVSPGNGWLSVSPANGSLDGGATSNMVIRADRSKLREGRSSGSVVITWDRGSVRVTVSLVEERAPSVGRPSAVVATSCTAAGRTVAVSASVTDESGLASVTLVWSAPSGTGSTPTSLSGSRWRTVIGPFIGDVTLRVVAKDERGNTTTGPPITVHVDPCPG